FGGFAETHGHTQRLKLVECAADGRIGTATRGRVGLAALGRHPQVADRTFFALQFGRPLHVFLGDFGRTEDGVVVTMQLDAETVDRFAGLGDAVDDLFRPAFFNADLHYGTDIGIGARADAGAEMQIEVGAELQAAIGVRDRDRALDI